jgi:hypothetical protein
MSDLGISLGVSSRQAEEFFLGYLQSAVASMAVAQTEVKYVAKVLAQYAQTPCSDAKQMSLSPSSFELLDGFVLPVFAIENSAKVLGPDILEVGGSQTLFLVSFFRHQIKGKYKIERYDRLGQEFFEKASELSTEKEKAILLRQIAEHFNLWIFSCMAVSEAIRQDPLIIKLDS